MEAFRLAIEVWGADMLELDVHASADGEVVVFHDDTLGRTTDGAGRVADLPWAALRELDAGARFTGPDGASWAGRGVRIPRLDDVLGAFPLTRVTVEIKDRRAALPTLGLIRRHGAAHRVLIAAAHDPDRAPAKGYEGPWGASAGQLRRFFIAHRAPLGRLYTPKADILQVPPHWGGRTIVTERFVAEAHRRNIPVHVWTIDDPAEMRRLLALGVDGIQSDRPDRLARVLTEVTGRPPPPGLTPQGMRDG